MDLEKRTARYYYDSNIRYITKYYKIFPIRFFNIPFKMKADPINLIGVVGSLQQQRFITAVLKVKLCGLTQLILTCNP